ncbi:hypothetical protein COU76_02530 [Candidatus Peregrinibacteria bacterium CG10_big_fil_rev_8_21_14_0_10_49_10]|nr:MAG: hypothetical protein COU76_02530 [Candidatus Peregrinibacteria bacterium CG10_big_fil_rev_8_21_14_0_10_49_10]
MHNPFRYRSGTSLVELLLFIGFFALVSGVVVALLFSSSEQRIRQQSIAQVDQTGIQLLQTLTRRIRRAERILDPALGETGALLLLQMAQDGENPTIITQGNNGMLVAEGTTVRSLTNSGNTIISNFVAQNTSPSTTRQSVHISFRISRTVPLPTNPEYVRVFDTLVTLFPDDQEEGNCGCGAGTCSSTGSYSWGYCDAGSCLEANTTLSCTQ